MSNVEFAEWDTPFKVGDVTVLDLRQQTGKWWIEDQKENLRFELPKIADVGDADLVVRVFHVATSTVYAVTFHDVGAFRLLDEHGLTELWSSEANRLGHPARSSFKVRRHQWSKESEVTFQMYATDEWSYVIATDWECVEVVCRETPVVEIETVVKGAPLTSKSEL